ncbi:MAG: peptidoglycan bridge formation glycyltransferase FemA/FemB family protein, partial [Prolixibacteraceae bacterium]|nr:peptidoglycan bridge formation glycyltransferase FemA/FemB family protein [Prolixibacteraceae bacterium]
IYPSVLATWKAIEYAAENRFEYFDFMGAGKPDEPYGVREFKTKFGGKVLEQGRFLHLCKPFLYRFSKGMLNIIRKATFK